MSDTSKRGFASMDQDKQREIASKGGQAAHEKGTAHEFTSEEAREAGRKGGETVSRDREHMAEIGSKGGHAAHEKGTAHEFTSEEAREAGRKGGETVSQDREHMAEIGSKGGKNSKRGSSNNDDDEEHNEGKGKGTQGGTSEQHSKAGKQSHKNKK